MKSRIRIFIEKRGILVLASLNLEEKGLILMFSVLLWKQGVYLGWKVSVLTQKGGSFWTEKSVFYREKRVVLSRKVSVLPQNKGVIFKLENKDGYHFFQWMKEPGSH